MSDGALLPYFSEKKKLAFQPQLWYTYYMEMGLF